MILDRLAPVLATIAAGVLLGLAIRAGLALSGWLTRRRAVQRAAERAARLAAIAPGLAAMSNAARNASQAMTAMRDTLDRTPCDCGTPPGAVCVHDLTDRRTRP